MQSSIVKISRSKWFALNTEFISLGTIDKLILSPHNIYFVLKINIRKLSLEPRHFVWIPGAIYTEHYCCCMHFYYVPDLKNDTRTLIILSQTARNILLHFHLTCTGKIKFSIISEDSKYPAKLQSELPRSVSWNQASDVNRGSTLIALR